VHIPGYSTGEAYTPGYSTGGGLYTRVWTTGEIHHPGMDNGRDTPPGYSTGGAYPPGYSTGGHTYPGIERTYTTRVSDGHTPPGYVPEDHGGHSTPWVCTMVGICTPWVYTPLPHPGYTSPPTHPGTRAATWSSRLRAGR